MLKERIRQVWEDADGRRIVLEGWIDKDNEDPEWGKAAQKYYEKGMTMVEEQRGKEVNLTPKDVNYNDGDLGSRDDESEDEDF